MNTCSPRDDFVTAQDGLRLHVRECGPRASAALPVVCLPGLARTTADFETLAQALAADIRTRRPAHRRVRPRLRYIGLISMSRRRKALPRPNGEVKIPSEQGFVITSFRGTSRGHLHYFSHIRKYGLQPLRRPMAFR